MSASICGSAAGRGFSWPIGGRVTGPVLADGRVLWFAAATGFPVELRSARPGGRSRRVASLTLPMYEPNNLAVGAGTLVSVMTQAEKGAGTRTDTFAGSIGGDLKEITQCGVPTAEAVGVIKRDRVVAYVMDGQREDRIGASCALEIVDLGDPAKSLPLINAQAPLAASPRFVAATRRVAGTTSIVVFDAQTGQLISTIDTGQNGVDVYSVDIDDTGVVVFAAGPRLTTARVFRSSVSAPRAREVPFGRGFFTVRLARGHLAVQRIKRDGNRFAVVRLGRPSTPRWRGARTSNISSSNFDFDGRRVTYIADGRRGEVIVVADA